MSNEISKNNDNYELGIVHIKENKLISFENEYDKISQKALSDKTYQSDFIAAYLAPVKLLSHSSSFESTFDNVIHHLTQAYNKSITEEERYKISRALEEIFQKVLVVLQEKKLLAESEAKKTFLKKMFESIRNIQNNFFKTLEEVNNTTKKFENDKFKDVGLLDLVNGTPQGVALFSIGPEAANIIEATVTYMFETWEIKQEAIFFNKQMVNIFSKIQNTECYQALGLVSNCFLRVKKIVLLYAFDEYGFNKCLQLANYDIYEDDIIDSDNIISNLLSEYRLYEIPYRFIEVVENGDERMYNIIRLFYQKNKEQIVISTYNQFGFNEANKLMLYDSDSTDENDTILTIVKVIAQKESNWKNIEKCLSKIKSERSNIIDKANKIAFKIFSKKIIKKISIGKIDFVKISPFIEYIKEEDEETSHDICSSLGENHLLYLNKKYSDKKGISRSLKIKNEHELFQSRLISEDEYNETLQRVSKNINKNKIILIAPVSLILVLISIWQYSRYKEYSELKSEELLRINNSVKNITTLIENKELSKSLLLVKEDVNLRLKYYPFSDKDEKEINKRQIKLTTKIIDKGFYIINNITVNSLDNPDYEYINNKVIIPIDNSISILDNDLKELYEKKSMTYLKKVNDFRNNYLNKKELEIKNLIKLNKRDEALELINNLYHHSNLEYKSGVLGIGSKSYQEYWKDEKEDLLESIKYRY